MDQPELTPTEFITRDLAAKEDERLSSLFPEAVALALESGAVVAGGAVLYALLGIPTRDIDVFVTSEEQLVSIAEQIEGLRPDAAKWYERKASTLEIRTEGLAPLQLIHTAAQGAEEVIKMFDLDYVQCAVVLCGTARRLCMTSWASEAHETKTIRRILSFPYNSWRLTSRLAKAYAKGFKLYADEVEDIRCLGVPLWKAPRSVSKEWSDRYVIDKNLPLAYFLRRDMCPTGAPFDLIEKKGYSKLVRADYEEDAEKGPAGPEREETEKAKGVPVVLKPPLFVDLALSATSRLRNKARWYAASGNAGSKAHFFAARALELILQRDYGAALASAMSDVGKLGRGSSSSYFSLAYIGLFREGNEPAMIEVIEQLFGVEETDVARSSLSAPFNSPKDVRGS